jgi:L-fuculose-phosphate aldolase
MLKNICTVLKDAYAKGWISSKDGNVSYYDQKEFWITPSGLRKYDLHPDQIVQLEFVEEEETQIKGDIKMPWEHVKIVSTKNYYRPSTELPFHYLIQKIATTPQCVLHLHPTNVVSAMYAGLDLEYIAQEFAEVNRHTRVGPTVRQQPPGSPALALDVEEALGLKSGRLNYDIIGLDRHGVIAIAPTPEEAFEHIERLEHVCQIILGANL